MAQARKALAIFAIAASVALTGCGGIQSATQVENTRLQEQHVTLENGRTVTCIVYWRNGGISCNW